jgi:hypothetical protein
MPVKTSFSNQSLNLEVLPLFKHGLDTMRETGSAFFQDNKIRSCSFVKESKDGDLKAVPFYDKRNNTVYPTKSDVKNSWNSTVHSQPKTLYAGMGTTKPLSAVNICFYFFLV